MSELLTIPLACERYPAVSQDFLYELVKRKLLKVYRLTPRGKIRFKPEDLERALEALAK
jgi:excisionase family DNA binding protein